MSDLPVGQLFTVAKSRGREGLLFSEDVSFEKVVAFVRDAASPLGALPVFVWDTGGDELFAATHPPDLPQADKAKAKYGRIWKVKAEALDVYDPFERFNRCSLLIKVMGCEHCEHNKKDCHEKGGAFEELLRGVNHPFLDTDALLKAGRAKGGLAVVDVAYVRPSWTASKNFPETIRAVLEHDFRGIEENVKRLSEKSKAAAATRKAHKTECGRCMFAGKSKAGNPYPGCDSGVNYCGGPFDTAEAQQKVLLDEWDPRVEEFLKTGEFTRGQFWAIARNASLESKSGRLKVLLSGWKHTAKEGFQVQAMRAKTHITEYPFANRNYGEVRGIFEGLPGVTAAIPEPPPVTRAVWYLSLTVGSISPRHGWGSRWRDIVYRQIEGDRVSIKTTAPSYLSWGSKELHSLYQAYLFFSRKPPLKLSRDQT